MAVKDVPVLVPPPGDPVPVDVPPAFILVPPGKLA
jgi:hypothetical protein